MSAPMKPTPAQIAAACHAMVVEHGEWLIQETPYQSRAIRKQPTGIAVNPDRDETTFHQFDTPGGAAIFVRMQCMSAAIEAATAATAAA
jgi:hypothetical protein